MSNRFSATHADHADKAAAAALHERATKMIDAGWLSSDYRSRCKTLADVRKLVEGAEFLASGPIYAPSTETQSETSPLRIDHEASAEDVYADLCDFSALPDSFTTPAVTDADEADRQEAISYMRHGGV